MSANTTSRSATIYEFPTEIRKAAIQREQAKLAENLKLEPLVAVSSGWYHEAAIQESASESKHRRDR